MKTRTSGYTLVEVVVALAIFALVSTLSVGIIKQAFDTRAHLIATNERMNAVELAISLIQRDAAHITNRAIRSTNNQLLPPFVGEANYVEFTRNGVVNPNALSTRSTMKRVALLCENEQLIRRTWATLDGPTHRDFIDKVLLDNLNHCVFTYLTHNLEFLTEWRPHALGPNQQKESLPSAVALSLSVAQLGKASFLFVIPEGLYGS